MRMKRGFIAFALVGVLSVVSCSRNAEPLPFCVIPQPSEVSLVGGGYELKSSDLILSEKLDENVRSAITEFAAHLQTVAGGKNRVISGEDGNGIVFSVDPSLGNEAYTLEITPKKVAVKANSYNGFIYAMQTIGQMLPAEFYGKEKAKGVDFVIPCGVIKDAPRFSYRGVLIDVGRHFYSVDEIKRCLDIMSVYKENVFHWHLTEDQG